MADGLTPDQERFAEWLATPKPARKPGTEKAFAASIGVTAMTCYRWRQLTSVQDRVEELVYEAVGGMDRVRQVVDKVFDDAMKGSVKDKELFLKFSGVIVDRRKVERVNLDYEEMTDEELDAEIDAEWDAAAQQIFDDNDFESLDTDED